MLLDTFSPCNFLFINLRKENCSLQVPRRRIMGVGFWFNDYDIPFFPSWIGITFHK
ncbi:hypothetical protein Cs308_0526 [Candidatus Chlamydia sanziniae]|uniref:Uncharacterized protein n=1 Tax=Candidatus Chlamydia sanziniae TaxID=1806891 RepID=A0A1A9HXP5_9CHLA|nr:hypothetical protein Cs308_0526 [Candidatus Chlamydia sanziniae]